MSCTASQQQTHGKGNYSLFGIWLRRLGETYIGSWLYDLFQASSQAMASAAATGPASMTQTASGGGGGPLSFMGCMREASPPPFDEPPPPLLPHHQHHRPVGLPTGGEQLHQLPHGFDSMPKEPKKRRFHPLRKLRGMFRRKSRGAADARLGGPGSGSERAELNGEHVAGLRDHEEVTLRDPAGRAEEIRSRSASELLTESSSDRDRLFLRRRDIEESFANNLQRGGAAGQLSVSHDSVFPGEVSHSRPLSSLDMHACHLERRPANANDTDHKDTRSAPKHRISLRVFEQIKTVIESRNQVATTTGTTNNATTDHANSLHNRFASRDKSERPAAEDTQAKVPRKDAPQTPTNTPTIDTPSSPLKEELPETSTGVLNHTAALHRISVRPKNRRPPRRSNSQPGSLNTSGASTNGLPRIDSISEISCDTLDSLETSTASAAADVLSNHVDTPPTTPQQPQPQPQFPPTQQQQPSPQEPSKPIPILRKSSSRLSRNSDVFEELEAKLPVLRKPAVSPDSLDSDSRSSSNDALLDAVNATSAAPPKPSPRASGSEKSSPLVSTPRRRLSSNQRLSKSPDSLESNSPGWLTKSSEGLFELDATLTNNNANNVNNINNIMNNNNNNNNNNNGNGSCAAGAKPVAAARKLLLKPISKSQERVCCSKSSDSLEAALEAENNNNSDDSMERRRSSFEINLRHRQRGGPLLPQLPLLQQHGKAHKLLSKSTECFDSSLAEQQRLRGARSAEEKRKRASVSEVNLYRIGGGGGAIGKPLLLSESFEKIAGLVETHRAEKSGRAAAPESPSTPTTPTTPATEKQQPPSYWRHKQRVTHSSESSDNLDLEDNCRLENRNRARRSGPAAAAAGKRLSGSGSLTGPLPDEETPRKPSPRLQKSSESSELGSTDTLDSERRNTLKSSDSDETLDSLEKELQEQLQQQQQPPLPRQLERRDEEETTEGLGLDSGDAAEPDEPELDAEEEELAVPDEKLAVGAYWARRGQDAGKESGNNLDIHLLAYSLVSKIQENGNGEEQSAQLAHDDGQEEDKSGKLRGNSPLVVCPKKKQHQMLHHQQSGSEDNKNHGSINNLLSSKTDEDLQNMLNGNISEVSTDTKSFKEKLIMFEKLGK